MCVWGGGGSGFHPYPEGYTATPVRVAEDGLKVMKTNKRCCAFVSMHWKEAVLGPGRTGGNFVRSGKRPGRLLYELLWVDCVGYMNWSHSNQCIF